MSWGIPDNPAGTRRTGQTTASSTQPTPAQQQELRTLTKLVNDGTFKRLLPEMQQYLSARLNTRHADHQKILRLAKRIIKGIRSVIANSRRGRARREQAITKLQGFLNTKLGTRFFLSIGTISE